MDYEGLNRHWCTPNQHHSQVLRRNPPGSVPSLWAILGRVRGSCLSRSHDTCAETDIDARPSRHSTYRSYTQGGSHWEGGTTRTHRARVRGDVNNAPDLDINMNHAKGKDKVAKGKAMVRKGRIKKDNMCPPVLDRRDKMEWHHCRHLPFRHLSVRPTLLGCSLPLHFR